ncbi:MAG: mRNA turnover and ribosome assembly protein [Bogoriella megaspora]|nr:MAG: mRNA turnover and ribosome assembly protein [Bogoriella megaspora]
MPKSKRARVVHLSKTQKKGKELSERLFAGIQEAAEKYQYCYVFAVDNMRNNYLKDVRTELSDSRIFFGKTKVMSVALGKEPNSPNEPTPGISSLCSHLSGNVGLIFTPREPESLLPYFEDLAPMSYARAGTPSSRSFTIPAGIVYSRAGEIVAEDDVPLPHSMEPTLRKWNVPTRLVKGRIELENAYDVCKEGQVLDSRQTALLKMFGIETSEFRVRIKAYWSAATQEVTVVEVDEERMEDQS